jgi:hypothetical protein
VRKEGNNENVKVWCGGKTRIREGKEWRRDNEVRDRPRKGRRRGEEERGGGGRRRGEERIRFMNSEPIATT